MQVDLTGASAPVFLFVRVSRLFLLWLCMKVVQTKDLFLNAGTAVVLIRSIQS